MCWVPDVSWDSALPCVWSLTSPGTSQQTLRVGVGHALSMVLSDHGAVFMEEGVVLSRAASGEAFWVLGAKKAHGKFSHFQIWLEMELNHILLLVLEPFIGSKLKSSDWEQ